MLEIVNELARFIGYFVLSTVGIFILAWLVSRHVSLSSDVSPEAKQIAREMDPNNPVEREATEVIAESLLESVRELQPDETIRSQPQPLTYFEWSTTDCRQEDIEHILSVLQDAGYYTHPLPDHASWRDRAKWSRERAGVWRSEPDWHIVQFEEHTGRMNVEEEVELPLPNEWRPEA